MAMPTWMSAWSLERMLEGNTIGCGWDQTNPNGIGFLQMKNGLKASFLANSTQKLLWVQSPREWYRKNASTWRTLAERLVQKITARMTCLARSLRLLKA